MYVFKIHTSFSKGLSTFDRKTWSVGVRSFMDVRRLNINDPKNDKPIRAFFGSLSASELNLTGHEKVFEMVNQPHSLRRFPRH